MLGLLGLLGLVLGGLLVDSLLHTSEAKDDDTADDSDTVLIDAAHDGNPDAGSILDYLDDDTGQEPEGPDTDTPDSTDEPPNAELGTVIEGTRGDDILQGQGGEDTILGDDGLDQILGRAGADWIDAGDGNDDVTAGADDDTVFGGAGNDALHGDAGNDTLDGGDGDDTVSGHDGNDSLSGGTGNDELTGGEGDDLLTDAAGDNWLSGGGGHDVLAGGTGTDVVDGGTGDDTLIGHDADKGDDATADYLNAGAGDDTIVLGSGDVATGDEGDDSFVLGDWMTGGGFAHIQDYNPAEDQILLMYDPAAHPDPDVLLVRDSESDAVSVFFDGMPLAMVHNGAGLSHADIRLTPTATAYPSAFHSMGAAA